MDILSHLKLGKNVWFDLVGWIVCFSTKAMHWLEGGPGSRCMPSPVDCLMMPFLRCPTGKGSFGVRLFVRIEKILIIKEIIPWAIYLCFFFYSNHFGNNIP